MLLAGTGRKGEAAWCAAASSGGAQSEESRLPDAVPSPPPALTALLDRASVPVDLLRDPAPERAALDFAVAAALRAPDHGGFKPARFVFIAGEARRAFGEVLAASLAAREPQTPAARLDVERSKPLRAPLLVAAGAAVRHDRPGVPAWEREPSAAAGAMTFLNALDAQGSGAVWLSSGALRDPAVKRALGFADGDALLGWIYAGTPAPARPRPARRGPNGFWRDWVPA